MKKTYIEPSIEMEGMEAEAFICGSQGVTSNNGITYGGVDEDGDIDPASRVNRDVWDEE